MKENDKRPMGMRTLDPDEMSPEERIRLWTAIEKGTQTDLANGYAQAQFARVNSKCDDEKKEFYQKAVELRTAMAESVLQNLERIHKDGGNISEYINQLNTVWLSTLSKAFESLQFETAKPLAISINRIYEALILALHAKKAALLSDEPRSIQEIQREFTANNDSINAACKACATDMCKLEYDAHNTKLKDSIRNHRSTIVRAVVQNLDNVRHIANQDQAQWLQETLVTLLANITTELITIGTETNRAIAEANQLMAHIVAEVAALPTYTSAGSINEATDETHMSVRRIIG